MANPLMQAMNNMMGNNPMMQFMQFASQFQGKSPMEMQNIVQQKVLEMGGITQSQWNQFEQMAGQFGVQPQQLQQIRNSIKFK